MNQPTATTDPAHRAGAPGRSPSMAVVSTAVEGSSRPIQVWLREAADTIRSAKHRARADARVLERFAEEIDRSWVPGPVVVIDPEDREQVERLARAYADRWAPDGRIEVITPDLQAALRSLAVPPASAEPDTEGEVIHCVMYRDGRMGTLCDSGAYGMPVLFTAVTEKATCPACRTKLDGGRA